MINKEPKPVHLFKGVDFEGIYVVHYEGYITSNYNHGKGKNGGVLRTSYDKRGYLKLTLSKNGEQTATRIHRLVATYFCENDDPINKTSVDHIDGDKENNCASNLEWVTPEENMRRARRMGLRYVAVNEELAHTICKKIWIEGLTDTEIGKELGISNKAVNDISSGKTHRHISDQYANGNWSPNSDRMSDELIHTVCEKIWTEGKKDSVISRELGVPVSTVNGISSGTINRHISEQYANGNWSPNSGKMSDELIHTICKKIWVEGLSDLAIGKELGISAGTIYNISSGKSNRRISDKYANDNWCPNTNRLSDEQKHGICKKIWIEGLSYIKIGKMFGVNETTVGSIARGKIYRDISEQYANGNWSPNTIKLDNRKIHLICEMVWNQGMTNVEIAKKLGLDRSTISMISRGKTHRHISEQYANGNWSPNSGRMPIDKIKEVCELRWVVGKSMKEIDDISPLTHTTISGIVYRNSNKDISLPYVEKAFETLCANNWNFIKDVKAVLKQMTSEPVKDIVKKIKEIHPTVDKHVIIFAIDKA